MQYKHSLTFETAPSPWGAYGRILVARKPALVPEDGEVPRMEARLRGMRVDPAHLASFRRLCGGENVDALPLVYPHLLVSPLQLALLSAEAFPMKLLGLVQLRNTILQYRTIDAAEVCDAFAWVEGHRSTPLGHEFDVHAQIIVGAEIVWEECSTYLARSPKTGNRERPAAREPQAEAEILGSSRTASFRAAADVGRQYARLSGDFNPIHLSALTAKMFGLRGSIAHGMWSLARCAAELEAGGVDPRRRLDVEFKRPVYLPSSLTLQWWSTARGRSFRLRDANGQRAHLSGTLLPEV